MTIVTLTEVQEKVLLPKDELVEVNNCTAIQNYDRAYLLYSFTTNELDMAKLEPSALLTLPAGITTVYIKSSNTTSAVAFNV